MCPAVICRVGSLENLIPHSPQRLLVICRVGSLEIGTNPPTAAQIVICRVGSLENVVKR